MAIVSFTSVFMVHVRIREVVIYVPVTLAGEESSVIKWIVPLTPATIEEHVGHPLILPTGALSVIAIMDTLARSAKLMRSRGYKRRSHN